MEKIDYSRIMIITTDNKSVLYSEEAKKLGVKIYTYHRYRGKMTKIINHFDKKVGSTLSSYFNNDWKKDLNNVDLLILNSFFVSEPIIKYVNKKYPNIRIIVWYSNPVKQEVSPTAYNKLNCELWSFDRQDTISYSMKRNNQFIDTEKLRTVSDNPKYYSDLCFIGVDKNRLDTVLQIEKILLEKEMKPFIWIVNSRTNSSSNYDYKGRLTYSEVINYEANSKSILDLNQKNQTGMTLRPLEAAFLKVKLITNNSNVKKEPFYKPENVLIIDDVESFNNQFDLFFNEKYQVVDDEVLSTYTTKGWIDNFFSFPQGLDS
ncbi:lipopolysaccharide biosynthesis protein [Enterococcus asini]|uniref:lipopolysaccharide biosynthesis protein n=1 Tax=Enterococcus asini TaxID=57732 RepID=UPI0032E45D2D